MEHFKSILEKEFNFSNLDEKLEKLNSYYNFLIEYNKKVNLTRITNLEDVYYKHFLDSILPFKSFKLLDHKKLFDIGSGAGFPGIVIAIFYPRIEVTLCESIGKKVTFLKELINHLKLSNVILYHGRSEEYFEKNKKKFDYITARAVSTLSNLFKYSKNLTMDHSYLIFYKGINYKEELVKDKHYSLNKIISDKLPNNLGDRKILIYSTTKKARK